MAFVNLSLLAGVSLVSIPIILHLAMRQQPKQMVFPAVRFLVRRQESNRRQLQLRHWILLALRAAAIAVLAFALARPSTASAAMGNWIVASLLLLSFAAVVLLAIAAQVYRKGLAFVAPLSVGALVLLASSIVMLWRALASSDTGLVGDPSAPVGAVVVIDTSPRMGFVRNNSSRLEKAQRFAADLLQQLPMESEVAVVESRPGNSLFAVDLAAAKSAISRLNTYNAPRPLPELIREAVRVARSSRKARKEVYVFTDMSREAWRSPNSASLLKELKEASGVALYLIDVGKAGAENVGLGEVILSAETMARNSPLLLRVDVIRRGGPTTRQLQLLLEEPDPRLPIVQDGQPRFPPERLRSEQSVELEENARQNVEARLGGLPPGVHHGRLRIVGEDGLAIDNQRYFTVSVKDAWPVLVVAPPEVTTSLFTEAIAPLEFRKTERTQFQCSVISQADLPNQALEDYVIVCLLDPKPMPAVVWERIARYVRTGGSLAVFLGHHAQAVESFNQPAAQQLLPGRLARQWRAADRGLFLAPRSLQHPMLQAFREISTTTPWRYFPVFKHWVFEDLAPEAREILHFSNNKPALIERDLDQGRVLVMTTPISDELSPVGRSAWNELPTGENPWPYFILANELMRYLADSEVERLNYLAGDLVVLPNNSERDPARYQLFTPADEPQEVRAQDGRLTIRFTEQPGHYRFKGNRGGPVIRGFSVNLPTSASDLERLPAEALDDVLGAGRYRLATEPEQLTPIVGDVRAGRQFFPFLVVMAISILALESVLANRFYRRDDAAPPRRAATRSR